MNKKAAKYSQRIGNLVIDFVDYYDAHEQLLQEGEEPWDLDEALEYFSYQQKLSPNDTYLIALQLKEQDYPIDPATFHPEHIPEDEREDIVLEDQFQKHSIFDKYTEALQRKQYERAHQIYESMTPTQKQVIRDRRGHMKKKIKTAQQETEAVLEKEVPVEPVSPGLLKESPKQESREMDELLVPAEQLVAQHSQLELPPDSMKVFLPFAHSLDEFKRVHKSEVKREELHKRTADFLRDFGKVLHYLDSHDYDVDDLKTLVKKYAELLYMAPVSAATSQKILALASKMQEKGMSDVANKLKVIANTEWQEMKEPTSIIEQAKEIVNQNPLSKLKDALINEKFDEAREIYTSLSPDQRKIADEISQKHFAVKSLVSLYRIGESLHNKGKIVEANEVSEIVKAQFVDLPKDMQQEVILLIIPQDGMMDFPQAFQGGGGIQNKLKGLENRLMPQVPELPQEVVVDVDPKPVVDVVPESPCGCGGCGCSAKSVNQLLKIADMLDEKGQPEIADQVTNIFEELKKQAQQKLPQISPEEIEKAVERIGPVKQPRRDVGEASCALCNNKFLYDKAQGKPKWCAYCGKDPWSKTSSLKVAQFAKLPNLPTKLPELSPEEIEEVTKRIEPPTSGREIGVLNCQQCGADVLFDRKKREKPQFCTYCAKMLAGDPWGQGRIAKKACDDQIEGGLSDSKPDDQFDLEEVEKGVKVEMEHTNDEKLAREIAKDHLAENDDYYKKLDVMEHSELKEMEKKEGTKAKEKKAALPGPYEPYGKGPLGLSSAEKAREQEARETRMTDPTGVRGPMERPGFVMLYQDGKPVMSISRDRARKLDTEGKIDLDWVEGKLCGMIKDPSILQGLKDLEAKTKIRSFTKLAAENKDDHGEVPKKVKEMADAIRRDKPEISDAKSYAMAWETFCSYTNPSYEGCTEKGKSHRESPKSEYTK